MGVILQVHYCLVCKVQIVFLIIFYSLGQNYREWPCNKGKCPALCSTTVWQFHSEYEVVKLVGRKKPSYKDSLQATDRTILNIQLPLQCYHIFPTSGMLSIIDFFCNLQYCQDQVLAILKNALLTSFKIVDSRIEDIRYLKKYRRNVILFEIILVCLQWHLNLKYGVRMNRSYISIHMPHPSSFFSLVLFCYATKMVVKS